MKRMAWFNTLGILLGLGVFVFFLPALLSKGSGKYLLLSVIHKETGLSCTIEDLHLSWFGPQKAKKIKVIGKDRQGELFSAETLSKDLYFVFFCIKELKLLLCLDGHYKLMKVSR